MKKNDKPLVNPVLVLREEFDDWAILFDPETGGSFGLNPVSVFIIKHLDGQHTLLDIMNELQEECKDAPDDAEKYVVDFIEELVSKGYAGYEILPEARV
jgi:SynChlorMet cassette protein ScmD